MEEKHEKRSFKFRLKQFKTAVVIRVVSVFDKYMRLELKAYKAFNRGNIKESMVYIARMMRDYPERYKESQTEIDELIEREETVRTILGENATHEQICNELEKRYYKPLNAKKLKINEE